MEPWKLLKELRQKGHYQQALEKGAELLSQNPDDFMVRSQLEWVHYDLIKGMAQEWEKQEDSGAGPASPELRNRLIDQLRDYARLRPQLPSMAYGNIVAKIAKVAKHIDSFPKMVEWFSLQDAEGTLGVPADQWKPNVWQGKISQSNALKLARALAAWVKSNPDKRTQENLEFALETAERVQRDSTDTDKLWLEWDLAALHRLAGNSDQAESRVRTVLRAKRSEFWPWAEAGRLYRPERPDLAISCFCQAVRLGNEPKFLGKIHIELAELLAESGEQGQASKEIVVAAEIYDQQGWAHPKELEGALAADWYDPSLPHESSETYYSQRAERALELCYDSTETMPANFLGFTEGRDGKKPLPRFAVAGDAGAVSLIGKRALLTDQLSPGQPLELTVARDGSRQDILELGDRADGSSWDVVRKEPAIVARVFEDGDQIEIYFDRHRHFRVPASVLDEAVEPCVGQSLVAGIVHVGKTNKPKVEFAEPNGQAELDDFRVVTGAIRRMDAGFGFIEDVFLAPHLLDGFPEEQDQASVMAVVKWNKKREEWGWQAITISQVGKSETESI